MSNNSTAQIHSGRGAATTLQDILETVTAEEFKSAFRNHAAGVSVITADAGDGPVALTATSVFSVSAEPPILVFSLSDMSSSTPTIREAETLVVHILDSDQLDLAQLCATSGVDRFADTSRWSRLVTGEPVFGEARVWIRGKVINRMEVGRSTVMAVQALQVHAPQNTATAAAEVTGSAAQSVARPLVYHNRSWHELSDKSKVGA